VGILSSIRGNQIYLDANIWIYALEGFPDFAQELTTLFNSIGQGNLTAVTSELSLAEVLVMPIKNANPTQQETYKQALSSTLNVRVIPVQRDILIEAARLRAVVKLKLPDAIHAATALTARCSTFLTNDRGFQTVPGFQVVLMSQVISP
jgi:predicted nucleic acid-binding protein